MKTKVVQHVSRINITVRGKLGSVKSPVTPGVDVNDDDEVKKSIGIFNSKERLLSLDMETKVVQHVPRINLSHLNF